MALLFAAVIFWHNQQKYLSFQTISPDADRFSQAIWGVWHGQFLFSTIKNGSILGSHFSPYFALLSPLILLWEDIRILYLAQIVHIAFCGLILWRMVAKKRPTLALIFLATFYLNPHIHQIALYELRRVPFAMPWLALIAYSINPFNESERPKWGLMAVGCTFALLTKEDMGLILFGVGAAVSFIQIIKRRKNGWTWGIPLMLIGPLWTAVMLEWVIPAFGNGAYPQLNYFAEWGESPADMITAVLTQPIRALQTMFDTNSFEAFGDLLRPFTPILLIALLLLCLRRIFPKNDRLKPCEGFKPSQGYAQAIITHSALYLLIPIPLIALMLLSNEPTMHALERWYLAPVLPFLFAAVSTMLIQISDLSGTKRWQVGIGIALLLGAMVGYRMDGVLWGGRHHQPWLYQTTVRSTAAWQIINTIPPEAHVMAQVAFSTQIAQRKQMSVYPWNDSEQPVDLMLLADDYNAYPFDKAEMHTTILNETVQPNRQIVAEGHAIYLIKPEGNSLTNRQLNKSLENAMHLDQIDIAIANQWGIYQEQARFALQADDQLRVTLYWTALADGRANRTISVRILDQTGEIVGQHDGWPVEGTRPTAIWQAGWQMRDVHYLAVKSGVVLPLRLEILVYDSASQERISFDDGQISLILDD